MEKQKNTQLLVIAILSIALLTMSVGFAVYSTGLNIAGNVTVGAATWNVHFDSSTYAETTGANYVTVASENRTIGTTAMSFNVTLSEPGKVYEYTIDVKNTGTFDAELHNVQLSTINSPQSNYLRYYVYYQATSGSGDFVQLSNGDISSPYELAKTSGAAKVKVRVEYFTPENANQLPGSDTNATITVVLNYRQK